MRRLRRPANGVRQGEGHSADGEEQAKGNGTKSDEAEGQPAESYEAYSQPADGDPAEREATNCNEADGRLTDGNDASGYPAASRIRVDASCYVDQGQRKSPGNRRWPL